MSDYKRLYIPGGCFFFTVVTLQRRRFLCGELSRRCLREAILQVRRSFPFESAATVLLPDHLHALWTLPVGDANYSARWRRIKELFTTNFLSGGGVEAYVSPARRRKGERGVWQRRFWEHTIRSERDFDNHFDYIHFNPVKHGLVEDPMDWPYSSFCRWVERGVYSPGWGNAARCTLDFSELETTAMEL